MKIYVLSLIVFSCFFMIETEAKILTNDQNMAVEGYDVTSLFNDSEPLKGKSDYSIVYKDAIWLFDDRENLEEFKQNPEKYIPAYDGYCVWAISHGRLTPGLVKYRVVFEGKLYLLCHEQALENWLKDPYFHINRANNYWQTLSNRL